MKLAKECSECKVSFENWVPSKISYHIGKHHQDKIDKFNSTIHEELKKFNGVKNERNNY